MAVRILASEAHYSFQYKPQADPVTGRNQPGQTNAGNRVWRPAGVARSWFKVLLRARDLIYLEDQYLWSRQVAEPFADALAANPALRMIVVVPRWPDYDGRLSRPPSQFGRNQVLEMLQQAGGRPDVGLRARKPCGHTRLRACEGLRRRRHLGLDRIGYFQPAVVDPRLRARLRGARPDPGSARAAPPEGRATTRGPMRTTCACR
jgi:hypothetical protein